MRFNKHLHLEGEHAFLSPSNYHWINYSPQKLAERWITAKASEMGVWLHAYAKQEIEAGRLSEHQGTLGMYINDCIRDRMTCEQVLFYSENCFGTADAIAFRYKTLKIKDLKSGVTKASVHQLEVYGALFCLEYEINPYDINFEFSIYQDDTRTDWDGDPDDIAYIMDKIVNFDKQINQLRLEERS